MSSLENFNCRYTDLAKAALVRFGEAKVQEYQEAQFRQLTDPLDRVFGRLDFLLEASGGTGRLTKGCLIGVFAQELSFTNLELRNACQELFVRTTEDFTKDLSEAKALHAPDADFDPKSVAVLYISILQGSLIMAKASETNAVLLQNMEQFRSYLQCLFGVKSKPVGQAALDHAHN